MTRPRGFINYKPKAEATTLLAQVRDVLESYRQYLPMTLRQLFYQLVSHHEYAKTEKAYKRLCEAVGKFRRAQLISMDDFRDDGFSLQSPWWFDGRDDFVEYTQRLAENYVGDRQNGQTRRILVWSEAAGLVPQLQSIVKRFGVRVCSSGGFDSLTTKHEMAQAFASEPTIVLHAGDFDPSGVHVYSSLAEDIMAFCDAYGGDCEFRRVAVLKEHIEQFDLPTAPPKETDKRRFDGDETVQLEALSPPELEQIVLAQVNELLDEAAYAKAVKKEAADRKWLVKEMGGAP